MLTSPNTRQPALETISSDSKSIIGQQEEFEVVTPSQRDASPLDSLKGGVSRNSQIKEAKCRAGINKYLMFKAFQEKFPFSHFSLNNLVLKQLGN